MAQRDIELVRAAFERFNRRDLDGLLEFLDDEVEMTPAIVGPDLPESYRGKEEVMRFFGAITDAWASVTARENELVELADGRILAVYDWEVQGRDGIQVTTQVVDVYEIRDGLCRRSQGYQSRAEALRASEGSG